MMFPFFKSNLHIKRNNTRSRDDYISKTALPRPDAASPAKQAAAAPAELPRRGGGQQAMATLGDTVPALASAGGQGYAASTGAVDSGVALLDACNAIAARVDRLRRRRLLSRLALHLLSSPSPTSVERARAALADRDAGASSSPPLPLPSLPFVDPPRSSGGRQLTAAARVLLAVNAVSSLAAAAKMKAIGHTELQKDFLW